MLVHCSLCEEGSPLTDNVKLVTIKGRDYLVCFNCFRQGMSHAKSIQPRHLPRVSKGTGKGT